MRLARTGSAGTCQYAASMQKNSTKRGRSKRAASRYVPPKHHNHTKHASRRVQQTDGDERMLHSVTPAPHVDQAYAEHHATASSAATSSGANYPALVCKSSASATPSGT